MAKTRAVPSLPAGGSQAGLHPMTLTSFGQGQRRDSFLAPSTRGTWIQPGAVSGNTYLILLPGRYVQPED
jgi:hypothetical protein